MASKITRKSTNCVIFGQPKVLSSPTLPSYEDVIRACQFERISLLEISRKEPAFSTICQLVATSVIKNWKSASIPTVSLRRVKDMINNYHQMFKKFLYNYKARANTLLSQTKLSDFRSQNKMLFDIAACKCLGFSACSCVTAKKVPRKERGFLLDQRTIKKMIISVVDRHESLRLRKLNDLRNRRKQLQTRDQQHEPSTELYVLLLDSDSDASKSSIEETDNTDNEEVFKLPSKGDSRTNLSSVAQVCDRAGVSDRTAALLTSSLLFDMGQINKNDQNSVIDHHKIRRERAKVQKDLQNSVEAELDCPFAIFFDGRIDKTLKKINKGYKSSKNLVSEEHICMLREPG